jgi:hypothetical protein
MRYRLKDFEHLLFGEMFQDIKPEDTLESAFGLEQIVQHMVTGKMRFGEYLRLLKGFLAKVNAVQMLIA